MNLEGKRILFFSAQAFGIPENIISTLQKKGATVDYYDERPANSFLVKALIRINRSLIAYYIDSYHKKIIADTKDIKYDYIFFIKGESFSESNLKELLRLHPSAKTIIYYWDSIANNHNALNLLSEFENAFSFDKQDCDNFGIKFLPLFYFDEYKKIANQKSEKKYDLLFVGTTHSDRYRFIKCISQQIEQFGGKCFTYFFFQGKIMFYKYKFLHKEMRGVKTSDVKFKPVKKNDLLKLYACSDIVVDIQHPKQSGLTLRCFEALGAKKKLITTNKEIVKYDFFNQHNILVVDRDNPKVPKDFVTHNYEEIDSDIYTKYSISSWVDYIFNNLK